MRSTTFAGVSVVTVSSTISLPAFFALMRLRSSSVYVSWYLSGFQSAASPSMSWVAIFSAFASGLDRRGGSASIALRGTTSSAKRIVDIASTPSSGRIAVRYCLLRITTVPIATRSTILHRGEQQLVRLLAGLAVGSQPVGALVVDRVDLVEGDEVVDLDRLRRCRAQRAQLFPLERDVVAFRELEPHLDVVVLRLRCPTTRRPCDAGCEHRTSCRAGGSGRRDRAPR